MSTTGMSVGFAKFASKTTKGAYDEARKGERFGRGIPFPVGVKGKAIVSAITCDDTKPNDLGESYPRVRVELAIEVPESHRGKPLQCGYFIMQDSKKVDSTWTAEDVWGKSMLGCLEDLGCPEELTKGYSDWQEVLDWFQAEPRRVNFEILPNDYKNNAGVLVHGKQVAAFAEVDEENIPSADTPSEAHDPNAKYCTFKGTSHRIMSEVGANVTIIGVNSGTTRTVAKSDVTMS